MPASLGLLYLVILASFLNLFLQFPLTPIFARALTTDVTLVALAVSAYSLANLAGNLLAGLVVDRYPKVPVMTCALGAGALALVGVGASRDIMGLVGGLMLNGLALALVTPAAFALLSQVLPDESRARGMASSGAAIGAAAMIGPPIAGVLADRLGPGPTFQAAGVCLLAVAVAGYALLRRLPDVGEADVGLGDIGQILADRRLRLGFAGAFVLMFANGGLVFSLPPHVRAMGQPTAVIGMLFSLFAIMAIAVFLSPLGKRAYRDDPRLVMAGGAGLIAIAFGALALAPSLPFMGAAMALYGLGFGLIYPAALSVLVANVPESRRGTAFGVFYALYSLGAAAGPLAIARVEAVGPFLAAATVPGAFAIALALWRLSARRGPQ